MIKIKINRVINFCPENIYTSISAAASNNSSSCASVQPKDSARPIIKGESLRNSRALFQAFCVIESEAATAASTVSSSPN